jgi:hypothetical protein
VLVTTINLRVLRDLQVDVKLLSAALMKDMNNCQIHIDYEDEPPGAPRLLTINQSTSMMSAKDSLDPPTESLCSTGSFVLANVIT